MSEQTRQEMPPHGGEKGGFDYRTGKLVWQVKYNKYDHPEAPEGAVVEGYLHLTYGEAGFYATALVPEGTQWGEEKTFEYMKNNDELLGSIRNNVNKFPGAEENPAYKEWERSLTREGTEEDTKD